MHSTTFEYLRPSASQMAEMATVREAGAVYADTLEHLLPNGPDKTYALRKLREVAMWANVTITRNADGSPRS